MQPNEQPQQQPAVPQPPTAPAEVPTQQVPAAARQIAVELAQSEVFSQEVGQPIPELVSQEPDQADSADNQPSELPTIDPIVWQSNEYAQHDKSPVWYIVLAVVVAGLMGVSIWFGAWSFAVLVPVMAVALMVYTHRPPQVINYSVSEQGLSINDTLHPMGEFRAFAVGQEMEHYSLMLIPVKRFRPAIKIFFPQEIGEELVDLLGSYMPSQEYHVDAFDKIIQKLHI